MSHSRVDLYDKFAEENSVFVSKSVSFHLCSVIHLPEIGSPSQKMIEMYLRSGVALDQALFVLFYQVR